MNADWQRAEAMREQALEGSAATPDLEQDAEARARRAEELGDDQEEGVG